MMIPIPFHGIYYLSAQNSNYGGRANYIQGGSQKLSDALMDIITENGGEVKLKHLVTQIDYEGKKPVGVTYTSSRGKEKLSLLGSCSGYHRQRIHSLPG